MIPGNSLSLVNLPTDWIYPDNLLTTRQVDWELGGIALNNGTQGLQVQVWKLTLDIDEESLVGSFYVTPENGPPQFLFSGVGITEGSLAFDQNMNPFVGYMQGGAARYWWFDTITATQIHSDLPANSTAPKATTDDKRPLQVTASDIIMCYTRAGNLYFRAQRDRYTVEYLLKTGVTGQVLKVGMNRKMRLQIGMGTFE